VNKNTELAMQKNANDFLSRSIIFFKDNDNKMALICLWSGVLLLLKIWIFKREPSLIFANFEKNLEYVNGTFILRPFNDNGSATTLDYAGIIKTFKLLGNSKSLLFQYERELDKIRRQRNRIEHFVFDFSTSEILSAYVAVLPFINDFIERELNSRIKEYLDCWDDYIEIEEVYNHRLSRQNEIINELSPTYKDIKHGAEDLMKVECPNCLKGILVNIEGEISHGFGKLSCPVCEHESNFIECERCGRIILEIDYNSFIQETRMCTECFDDLCDKS